MKVVDNINLNLALNTCVEQMSSVMKSSKKVLHSTMGCSAIKKVSIYEESLHKDVVKDCYIPTVLLQNLTLVVLWQFWLRDPFGIKLTSWYVENANHVAAVTCGLVASIMFVLVTLGIQLLREAEWHIEYMAEALGSPKIVHVYYDIWLWVPCNVLVVICLFCKSELAANFWIWFAGDIIYFVILTLWATNDFFDDDFEFSHVFIDTKRIQVPSANAAVNVKDGLHIVFSNGQRLCVDLRKCKMTVYGKGTLIVKWHKPKKFCYLTPSDYDCLEVRHFNGALTVYSFKEDKWVKEEVEDMYEEH